MVDTSLDKKFEEETKKSLNKEGRKAMTMQEAITEIARQEGMEEGMEKGMEKGLEKGRAEERERFARNLIIDLGLNDDQVAKTANVTVEFVKNLRKTFPAP